jgi:hypothetical protein
VLAKGERPANLPQIAAEGNTQLSIHTANCGLLSYNDNAALRRALRPTRLPKSDQQTIHNKQTR